MPEKQFWRMLEDLPGQKAPLAVWRNRLGDWPLFDQIQRRFLLVTGQRAASLECPTPCCPPCPRRVVEYAPDDIEAVCPEQETPSIKIADKDLLFYGLKQSAIMKAVCDAIGIEHKPSEPAGCHLLWRIGDFIPPLGGVPVYVSMSEGPNELDGTVKYLCLLHSDPIVLMTPTRRWLSATSEQMLEQRKSVFMAMEEELIFAENGNLKTSNPKGYLFRNLLPKDLRTTPTDPLPQNVFRQYGSRWQMRFQGGEAVFLERQKGAEYITSLLGAPHQAISVLDLYNNSTMDEQTRIAMKSGGFDLSDEKYLGQCRNRIVELNRGIMEADQFNDLGQMAKLQREKDQILKQVKELIGPGGILRRSNDPLKKPRDAVSKAIQRTIKNIRKAEMNYFADHLKKWLICGNEMMYYPSDDIYWYTAPIVE
jgi:hypothetical protein